MNKKEPVEIDKSSFNWNKFTDGFEARLKKKGIEQEHVIMLADALDDNWARISELLHDSDSDSSSDEDEYKNAAQEALALAEEQCSELFLDQFGTPYAAVKINEHTETLPLKSSRFKNWLCGTYYNNSESNILNAESVTNVLNVLKAKAEFEGVTRTLDLRVTSGQDQPFTIYYDLANKDWQVVKITSEGWSIVDTSPIIFRRYKSQQPQVYPSRQYSSDVFDMFMDVMNIKDRDDRLVVKGYITSLFYPDIERPISLVMAEQGSAKTTEHELEKKVVDPGSIETLTFPRDKTEMIQTLAHNYVAYFDNVSNIRDWQSDLLCRAATGGGSSKRELYTDDDDVIYNFIRGTGINGINITGLKADLLHRSILRKRQYIPKEERRKKEDICAEFETLKPGLLGYIFDVLVKVLQVKSKGSIKMDGLPRMADFAEIAEIACRCMDYNDNEFLKAYDKNIELQTEEAIAGNLLSSAIIKFMEDKDEWTGTATVLLESLEQVATSELKINPSATKQWPKAANALSGRLDQPSRDWHRYTQGENHAQITDYVANDHNCIDRSYRSQPETSFAENEQNRAQNTTASDVSKLF